MDIKGLNMYLINVLEDGCAPSLRKASLSNLNTVVDKYLRTDVCILLGNRSRWSLQLSDIPITRVIRANESGSLSPALSTAARR